MATTLQGLVAFTAAARAQSFARAARELGLSPSAVAKDIARLERQLGVRLFLRTTRRVTLTGEGRDLFERSVRVLDELEALEDAALGARAAPAGVLRLSVPLTYGRLVVVPALAELRRRHPALEFDVRFSDAFADLLAERLDAVIRVGEVPDSRLVARRIDWQPLVTIASPDYLHNRPAPSLPADLASHACLRFRLPTSGRLRPLEYRVRGRAVTLDPHPVAVLDDGEAVVAAAVHGLGIGQVPEYMAGRELAAGSLLRVLDRYAPAPMPISIVHAHHRQPPPRLRALIDQLTRTVSDSPRRA
jgi:LysR family transcriptional regulator for bpeEF and oprC